MRSTDLFKSICRTLATLSLLISINQLSAQKDYTIKIDDQEISIALDSPETINLNGTEIQLELVQNDTLEYLDEELSFKYLKDFAVTKTAMEGGMEQLMIMSAEGAGIMVQKHTMLDPSFFKEMMLSEVTKESVSYGYDMKREDYSRKLNDGSEIDVLKAVLEYRGSTSIYEVASIAGKDKGVLVITMIPDISFSTQHDKIIDVMWKSLEYK